MKRESRRPAHRPKRRYPDAERVIVECELKECVHCGGPLVPSGTWHVRKYVQTLNGPLFVAGKSKQCDSPDCVLSTTEKCNKNTDRKVYHFLESQET